MENIIARQINSYLESHKYLRVSQSGFMRVRSYTTALLNVVENLRLELYENSVPFLVLLDHTKAFDTVNHKILLNNLRELFQFSNLPVV